MALASAISRAAAAGAGALGATGCLQAARGWVINALIQSDVRKCIEPAAPTGCRSQHIIPERQGAPVVPEAFMQELRSIEATLQASSLLDGRLRSTLPLSAQHLPAPLPDHAVEPGLPSLEAHVRPPQAVGGTACKWLRRSGRVPGRVHSLPPGAGTNLLLHFDEVELGKMVRSLGRNGCTAHVLQLNLVRPILPPPEEAGMRPPPNTTTTTTNNSGPRGPPVAPLGVLRVKPVRVHMNAVTQRLEGLDLLYCPPDRVVQVDVPIRLVNDDQAPGVKKGGWMYRIKRTVRYKALGNAIPPYIEVNVRHLDLEQEVLVRDLPIPPGTKLYEKNYNAPVLRCTADMGKD